MKAITLWQPWATWIACGYKTIETRTHWGFRHLAGQRVAIHAGQSFDEDAIELARLSLPPIYRLDIESATHQHGIILATALVGSPRRMVASDVYDALCPYEKARVCYPLFDVRAVHPGIYCSGHQGAWTVPEEIAERLVKRGAA